jgi:hypothetical protein
MNLVYCRSTSGFILVVVFSPFRCQTLISFCINGFSEYSNTYSSHVQLLGNWDYSFVLSSLRSSRLIISFCRLYLVLCFHTIMDSQLYNRI